MALKDHITNKQFTITAPIVLRVSMSLVFFWFGFAQLANTSMWVAYLPEFIASMPISAEAFVFANGIFEIIFSTGLLLGFHTRISAFLLGAHLLGIAFTIGVNATGIRDFGLSIATLSTFLHGPDNASLDQILKNRRVTPKKREKNEKTIIHILIIILILAIVFNIGFFFYQQGKIKNKVSASQKNALPENTARSITTGNILTQQTIGKHNTIDDCWIIINDALYDVTEYISQHPGGKELILSSCGKDATQAFASKGGQDPNGHSAFAQDLLKNYFIGDINEALATPNKLPNDNDTANNTNKNIEAQAKSPDTTSLTNENIATHNSGSDCWLTIENKVYNVTTYVSSHPGGAKKILQYCGKDGSAAFGSVGHSSTARNILSSFYIGDVNTIITTDSLNTTQNTSQGLANIASENTIEARFPGAQITKTEYEDDGRQKFELIYEGILYKIKTDSIGNITDVEEED